MSGLTVSICALPPVRAYQWTNRPTDEQCFFLIRESATNKMVFSPIQEYLFVDNTAIEFHRKWHYFFSPLSPYFLTN